MVPHTKVENEISEILFPDGSDQVNCAVIGLPDRVKGEKLILLTTEDYEIKDVRKKLLAKGIPNLWIPKESKKVPEIPILASGKLDLSELKRLGLSID